MKMEGEAKNAGSLWNLKKAGKQILLERESEGNIVLLTP